MISSGSYLEVKIISVLITVTKSFKLKKYFEDTCR